jgi:HPt (histidine-containing phosphotransfer) domain-containing protein
MNGHLSKPVVRAELLDAVERWLLSADVTAAQPESAAPPPSDALVDEAALRELEEDVTAELLPRVIRTFVDETEGRLSAIESSLAGGDLVALAGEAHALKGAAGTFGAGALHNLALEMELAARAEDREAARALLPRLVRTGRESLRVFEKRIGFGVRDT